MQQTICRACTARIAKKLSLNGSVSLQGVKDKEVIAVELAAAETHIGNTAFGQMLLRRYVLHNPRFSVKLSTCPLYSSPKSQKCILFCSQRWAPP